MKVINLQQKICQGGELPAGGGPGAYRQLIMTTRDLGECICVVILCDETIHHPRKGGIPLVKIISPEGSVAGVAGS